MTELQLQHEIAREFSEKFPKKRGQLFHVSNERNNPKQAFRARAIGIQPGVSDYIFFSKKFNVATELKVPGSRHKVSRIKTQLEWGKLWERKGNVWRLCKTKDEAMSCYRGKFKGLTTAQVQEMLDRNGNKKTIVL